MSLHQRWSRLPKSTKAALIAVVPVLVVVLNWLPGMAGEVHQVISRITERRIVLIQVRRGIRPQSGISVAIRDAERVTLIASDLTDGSGAARLKAVPRGYVWIECSFREGLMDYTYSKVHKIESLPYSIELDVERDFYSTAVRSGPPLPIGALRYGGETLQSDRHPTAILHIERLSNVARLHLEMPNSPEMTQLIDALAALGLRVVVEWGELDPANAFGGVFTSEDQLLELRHLYMPRVLGDPWVLYVIYGADDILIGSRGREPSGSMSAVFGNRDGAVVVDVEGRGLDPAGFILHALGHVLNLPDETPERGERETVMSPSVPREGGGGRGVYQFSDLAKLHVRRAPDPFVRPGGSRFLDYGVPQPWIEYQNRK